MIDMFTGWLNISPEYTKTAFWIAFFVGCVVLWHFRKLVLIIGAGAVAVYIAIKNSFANND